MTERATPAFVYDQEEAPTWMYKIRAGNTTATYVQEGKVSYGSNGGSSLTCLVPDGRAFERQQYRRVDVEVCQQQSGQADKWHPVFSGIITRAHTEDDGLTDLEAFGPRTSLASRYFVRRKTYQAIRFDAFISDIASRIRGKHVRIDLRGGGNFVIDKRQYQGETSLAEAVDQIAGSALNIVADRPGMVLLVAPQPRPGVRGREVGRRFEIGPGDYAPRSLKTPLKDEGPYGQVIVFRRNQTTGDNDIEESARVDEPGKDADLNQVYFIPEFTGTTAQAATTAYRMARRISKGLFAPSVKSIIFERPLFTFDPVYLIKELQEDDGRILRIPYDCIVEQSTLDLVSGMYDLKLDGVEGRAEIRRRPFETDTLSPYLKRTTEALL